MSNILYIGNKLSDLGFTPGVIETLGYNLERSGYRVIYAGTKLNQFSRLQEMLIKVVINRKIIDYVLIDTYSTKAFWYAFMNGFICHILRIKYIPILHGGNLPARLRSSPYMCNLLFKHSYANVAVSNYLRYEFGILGYESVVIPNTIDIYSFPFKERITPRPKLLWVRSFHRQYNPRMAVDVLAELLKAFPDAELCMVGPDRDGSMLEFQEYAERRNVINKIKITGKLTKDEWSSLSEEYDFFINTTDVDNTPVSIIEALALGLCVISTNPGGVSYLLHNAVDAELCNSGDFQKMSQIILNLLNDYSRYRKLTIKGRETAESYSWESVRNQWDKLLQKSSIELI